MHNRGRFQRMKRRLRLVGSNRKSSRGACYREPKRHWGLRLGLYHLYGASQGRPHKLLMVSLNPKKYTKRTRKPKGRDKVTQADKQDDERANDRRHTLQECQMYGPLSSRSNEIMSRHRDSSIDWDEWNSSQNGVADTQGNHGCFIAKTVQETAHDVRICHAAYASLCFMISWRTALESNGTYSCKHCTVGETANEGLTSVQSRRSRNKLTA